MDVYRSLFDGAVKVLRPRSFADVRGYFMESWRDDTLAEVLGMDLPFVQDNESLSARGVLRGLHYQWDPPQGKLVRCARGKVLDVAVDLRRSSPTLGQAEAIELSAENRLQIWIPPGFAHGFLSLSDESLVLYKCTARWSAAGESGLWPLDPELSINWPFFADDITLSPKDAEAKTLADYLADPVFD